MAKKVLNTIDNITLGGKNIHEGDTVIFTYTKANGETLDYAVKINGLTRTHVYGDKLGASGMRSFIVENMRNIRKI